MIGHLLGAAAAVEAVATVQAVRTGAARFANQCHASPLAEWPLPLLDSPRLVPHGVGLAPRLAASEQLGDGCPDCGNWCQPGIARRVEVILGFEARSVCPVV
jgi:hypothetical protein